MPPPRSSLTEPKKELTPEEEPQSYSVTIDPEDLPAARKEIDSLKGKISEEEWQELQKYLKLAEMLNKETENVETREDLERILKTHGLDLAIPLSREDEK